MIDFNQLQDKDTLRNSNLLKTSFEYMILKICEKYKEHKKINTLDDFNKKNDLSLFKFFLYPFFVSTSNGHSKSLFELFGNFKATQLGPIPIHFAKELKEENYSIYFVVKPNKIFLNSEIEKSLQEILNSNIVLNNENTLFKNCQILNDKNEHKYLYKAIESGINTIDKQSLNNFFLFDEEGLTINSFKYRAFTNKLNETADNNILEYNKIAVDKQSLPFYSNLIS